MKNESRQKMVSSAAALIRTKGVNATSFSDIVADSRAPRGSIYHHFPQGKEQLASDAIRLTSERVIAYQRSCPAANAHGVLDWFIELWRRTVVASGGAAGCVVAGVAVDTMPDAEALMSVVRSTFQSWVDLLSEQLESTGMSASRARSLAVTTLASMEGALILCRSERSVQPLETVAAELKLMVSGNARRRTSRGRAARE